ncbi:MAG: hypothetical protein GF388_08655, partial [Candidatus Aegiribacteria sp.]|nr:hypothetical protein [Candidatus Aegiribacteria sp.]MBD3295146.1 hypothetical protein [Candidatus Fermentibacteria bacterium]
GRNQEPVLLPAKLPVLLLLGAEGIAVGMSTKILPHNFQEVIQAQIACLKDQDFQLYPDFPQGGRIDVSDYEDGAGRIVNRARIEKQGRKNLIIRELPWGTTTESVINSIELASKKGKVKVSSIDDYTTDKVEINIRLARGVTSDEGIKRLYAHTDCETSHSSKVVVIQDGAPVETTISEIVHYCTGRLIEVLKLELKLEISDYVEKLHWLTLEQIFIENRLYKNIEECGSLKSIRDTVESDIQPFIEESKLEEVTEEDIDRLLALKIRRISRFDIDSHKEEMDSLRSSMKKARSNLRNIVRYAVDYLQDLLEEYGSRFPRLTSIEDFSDIDVKEVAIRNLKAGFNTQTRLIGTSIKGNRTFSVSEYDRFVFFLGDGTYRVIPVQDKYFIDGDVLFCGVLDKKQVFTAVYKANKSGVAYIKRFRVESFIMDKEYRYVPEGGEVIFFTAEQEMTLDIWFQRRKRMRKRKDTKNISEIRVTSDSAKGVQLCGRKPVSSIQGLVEEEEPEEQEDGEEDTDDSTADGVEAPEKSAEDRDREGTPSPSPDEVIEKAEELKKESSSTLKKAEEAAENDSDDLFSGID